MTEQTRNESVDSLNKRRKKWAKAIINHTNESTYVRGSALKTAVLGSGASEEDTKGFEQVIGDLVACCALHPMIDNDGNYSVKLWRTIRHVTPGPRGEGVYLIGDRGPSIEMKESKVRYGNLGPGDGDDIPVLEGREYSVVNDNDNATTKLAKLAGITEDEASDFVCDSSPVQVKTVMKLIKSGFVDLELWRGCGGNVTTRRSMTRWTSH